MSRAKQQAAEVALLHFFKTERVVRLECERRESKAHLKLIDNMSADLDDQLLYVAQFKKEWLQSRRVLEEARQALVQAEGAKRGDVEEEYVKALNKYWASSARMSAFTTPRRTSASTTALPGRPGGGSSARRVVRSALEMLTDTTPPEPIEGRLASAGNSIRSLSRSAARQPRLEPQPQPPSAATPAFSVTYATAPPSLSPPAGASARGAAAKASARRAEPSALDFLSPHAKDPSRFDAGDSGRSRRGRHADPAPATARGALLREPAAPAQEDALAPVGRKAGGRRGSRAETTGVSISPSRSLYSDVVAAQQPASASSPTTDSPTSSLDTSFAQSPSPRLVSARTTTVPSRQGAAGARAEAVRRSGSDSLDVSDDEASAAEPLVTQAEVSAIVAAALRRYEKERDAEEEAVLQQVSAEVEQQASRYAELVEAHTAACAERTELQDKLLEAASECEELEHALHTSRQTQLAQREAMRRLEVELHHAKDQQRATDAAASAAADWETQRARLEKRHATFEAQLTQTRAEVRDREARLAAQADEIASLRHAAAATSAETADEYADIQRRMRQLAQNMAAMEGALRDRDDVIAQQAAQLGEASSRHESEVRALTAERETCEAALTSTREALQRRTDAIRRRVNRVAHLERQNDDLREASAAALQALRTAATEQARVVQSLEGLSASAAKALRRGGTTGGGAVRTATPPSPHGPQRSHRALPSSQAATGVDATLVYEDDRDASELSDIVASSSAGSNTLELSSSDEHSEDDTAGEEPRRRRGAPRSVSAESPASRRTSTPPQSRRARTASPPSHTATAAAGVTVAPAAATAQAPAATKTAAVRTAAQELRRQTAQALHLVRELHRRLASAPSEPASAASSTGHGRHSAGTRSGASAAKLEDACRYLKAELAQAHDALQEARADCQWRELSMRKWEADVQAARRDLLAAEKQRLAYATQAETAALVREELEAQVAELKAACAAATAAQASAEAAIAAAQPERERIAAQLREATAGREAAETALAAVKAATAAHTAAASEEFTRLQEKHAAALAQLQECRGEEATRQTRAERESRTRGIEVAELRTALATANTTHGAAERAWRGERAALEARVSGAAAEARAAAGEATSAKARAAALAEELRLHAELERATLRTVGEVAGAPPLPRSAWAGASAASAADATPTEKQLFRPEAEEPEVEEVALVLPEARPATTPAAAAMASFNAAASARVGRGRATALCRVAARLSTSSPSAPPSPSTSTASRTCASQPPPAAPPLPLLRQHIVAAVQQLALEVGRLRRDGDSSHTALPHLSHPRSTNAAAPTAVATEVRQPSPQLADGDGWFGAGPAERATSRSPSHAARSPQQQPQQPPHTPQHPRASARAGGRSARRFADTAAASRAGERGGSSPSAAASPPPLAASEHLYNISPWSRLRSQRSPSQLTSPPVSHPTTVLGPAKAWSAARRSSSTEDGLSGYSPSAGRGDVDGSGSPARPPSLRAPSLAR